MDRLKERLNVAEKALRSLLDLPLAKNVDDIVRDAAIQRFEYSFEAVWKAAQLYLRETEGLEQGSPKGVVRASLQVGILTDGQARLALELVDDRNLTVHTYNEELAKRIFSHLQSYAELMTEWLRVMQAKSINP
ncbi:MAG: HI0074 family nucleotidyltransferase substrate-binding subunit [Geoalkalibacter sp.]|jgi:nucleotidyltransferase substrate binding protein (TIGR01987 family)|uniref:HI0074 family nucleotidyltransferase substrate-binding subunit n=1 Tax=Geoalkalibacter sp. TaxID=3041440 RepID=UPI003D1297EA